jgi:hypothetical protein
MMTAKSEAYNRWYTAHRDEYLAIRRARYAADPDFYRGIAKRWGEANRDKRAATFANWYQANPGYSGQHYWSTPHRTSVHKLCKALHNALIHRESGRDWYPNSKIGPLIGCSKPELVAHIEAQFQPGMSWENYGRGGWEIDHIIPCGAFDLTEPAQQRACFHFTNLRPLWRIDNLRRPKGRA